jgi:hypothetical protein
VNGFHTSDETFLGGGSSSWRVTLSDGRLTVATALWALTRELAADFARTETRHSRHRIVDDGAFGEDDLEGRDALPALLFRLESSPNPEQVIALAEEVLAWFVRHPGFEGCGRFSPNCWAA